MHAGKNYIGNVGNAYNMTVALQSQVAHCNAQAFLLIWLANERGEPLW